MKPHTKTPAIILAAGKGTRMKSELPKVLAPVLGRPMILYPLDALRTAGINRFILVVGYKAEEVQAALAQCADVEYALQTEQKGTGHAVMMCKPQLQAYVAAGDGPVVVVAGDAPLMQAETIHALLADWEQNPVSCLLGTITVENPTGMGRILRDADGNFVGIIEEKDATDSQKKIREVNQSYYVFLASDLLSALEHIRPNNAQAEYYITDCPALFLKSGKTVRALPILKPVEAVSVNTQEELKIVEEILRKMSFSYGNISRNAAVSFPSSFS